MDNKLTFTGGEPNMNEDDFLRTQQSNRPGLHGIGAAFNNGDPFIVSGCETTPNGPNIDVAAGYIFFGGELIQVDAQINVDDTEGNGFYRYEIETTFEAGGDKTYLDSTPRQTWEKKRGIAVSVVSISGGDLDVKDGKRFDDLINDLITGHGAWQVPSYVNNHSDYTAGDYSALRYRLLANGMLQLAGSVTRSSVTAGTIFTLDAGFRPPQSMPIVGRREDDSLVGGFINSSGVVSCLLSAADPAHLDFNVIIPMDLTV